MKTQNVTLSLPKETLQQAKLIAVRRETSLSRLLAGLIQGLVKSEERYELARRRHLTLLEQGFDLGTGGRPAASREELHER
jgi:hypothetical protein